MYTQCPECATAFRVTADILKQAAGKVRCGGCGHAFNALSFLSEQKPAAAPKPPAEDSVPELTPDSGEADDAALPRSISPQQSAALLKTLDELAGSDIRIEDTGVEWRVVDEQERDGDNDDLDAAEESDSDGTGSIRWFIDDSPTPVDEQLSAEPGEVDAPEIFEQAGSGEQMRFDDDTPLPEDFDFDAGPASEPEPIVEPRDDPLHLEAEQVDLALGEPEDWEDLLEEVDEAASIEIEADVAVELDAGVSTEGATAGGDDQTTADKSVESTPLPDVDEQFATQAEAMGIDLSGMRARLQESPGGPDAESRSADDQTSIDDDLVAAAFETEAATRAEREAGIVDEKPVDQTVAAATFEDGDAAAAENSHTIGEAAVADTILADTVLADTVSGAEDDAQDDEIEFDLDFDAADLIEARDRELVSSTEEDAKLAAELGLDDTASGDAHSKPEPVFLPESEEEKTANLMIDQDLLAIAVEDEDGFATTIVQKQSGDVRDEPEVTKDSAEPDEDDPLVETIIMEGEFIRDADEEERLERARRKTGDPNLKSAAAADVKELPDKEEKVASKPVDYRMVAGIAALAILLLAQGVHQMRESLVTLPVIGAPLGALYRAIGRPVTPDWDISGWRFEATKGSTDEDDAMLTIYSRVGNKSAEPLPYPLISVSLTDRYEDIIGSKVLEPGEYLAGSLDTRRPVAPGDTFSAVISIEAPSADATGFKLNVCYRQAGGMLKCAVDDFK